MAPRSPLNSPTLFFFFFCVHVYSLWLALACLNRGYNRIGQGAMRINHFLTGVFDTVRLSKVQKRDWRPLLAPHLGHSSSIVTNLSFGETVAYVQEITEKQYFFYGVVRVTATMTRALIGVRCHNMSSVASGGDSSWIRGRQVFVAAITICW
jgi:hypothetical protein